MTLLSALPRDGIPALWIAWFVWWLVAARDAKPTRWREPAGTALLHVAPLICSVILLLGPRWLPRVLMARVLPPGPLLPILGAAIVAAGLALAIWARRHLGRNWSGWVTLKENHALIRTGPYRVVRHPIYTGLLLAIAGTGLAIGEWRGVLALALGFVGCLVKMRMEEARMRQTFPTDYAQYRRETAALIPLLF